MKYLYLDKKGVAYEVTPFLLPARFSIYRHWL